MQVPHDIQVRVAQKIQQCMALAVANLGPAAQIRMPKIKYDKRGRVAGTASYVDWEINLNAVLLMENVDEFIDRTVPHELGHLITDKLHPENHRPRKNWMTGKREKRDVHGPDWQRVCRAIGMTDVTRCHSFDTTNSRVIKNSSRFVAVRCGCGAEFNITPNKAAKLDKDPTALWHRGCKGKGLVRVNAAEPVIRLAAQQAQPVKPAAQPKVGESKMDACKRIYAASTTLSRQQIIAKFIEVGCTPAGANTYYATCKKLLG